MRLVHVYPYPYSYPYAYPYGYKPPDPFAAGRAYREGLREGIARGIVRTVLTVADRAAEREHRMRRANREHRESSSRDQYIETGSARYATQAAQPQAAAHNVQPKETFERYMEYKNNTYKSMEELEKNRRGRKETREHMLSEAAKKGVNIPGQAAGSSAPAPASAAGQPKENFKRYMNYKKNQYANAEGRQRAREAVLAEARGNGQGAGMPGTIPQNGPGFVMGEVHGAQQQWQPMHPNMNGAAAPTPHQGPCSPNPAYHGTPAQSHAGNAMNPQMHQAQMNPQMHQAQMNQVFSQQHGGTMPRGSFAPPHQSYMGPRSPPVPPHGVDPRMPPHFGASMSQPVQSQHPSASPRTRGPPSFHGSQRGMGGGMGPQGGHQQAPGGQNIYGPGW
ncbi:hypothetical protein LTR66_000633 [Elasticomyces elasticus]|nr:hypothetical protein LTR66_000633 [Elasticomyces elasticus]